MTDIERDVMEYDVVVVGAGPAGLSAAMRLKQLASESGRDIEVCVVEKGSEVGAHLLSGAVLETRALDELIPDWKEKGAPLKTPVTHDDFYFFTSEEKAFRMPNAFVPRTMHNKGNYIVSLGMVCRWLGEQAEALGVEIYPGFAAQDAIIEDGVVKGIVTGDMGVDKQGNPKDGYTPGIELRAKYTLFAEGARGHLGKRLIAEYKLDAESDPQHYAIGLKELWEVEPGRSQPGLVVHGAGWPLSDDNPGGSFLYHLEDNIVSVGLIVDLAYQNPYLSPFHEFQRFKHHPKIAQYLQGGKRLSYGARAITKGGYNSLPKMVFPGGALLGCNAGTLNFAKIKGNHPAMKSGMLAAEAAAEALGAGREHDTLEAYPKAFEQSWLYQELREARNFGPAIHKFGAMTGGALNFIEQSLLRGKVPWNMHDRIPDHTTLKKASESKQIDYPRHDGKLSFDKLSSVHISNTGHDEDQPVHLRLTDPSIPVQQNLPEYAEPAQRYCPAGVYEIVEEEGGPRFQINAANCVHCKTCDIKDPAQNINWVPPEGGGGPNYSAM